MNITGRIVIIEGRKYLSTNGELWSVQCFIKKK